MGSIVLGLIIVSGSASLAGGSDSVDVIQLVRSFFDEDSSRPSEVSKAIFEKNNSQFAGLQDLVRLHFQPKDIWGNRDYVFGYGLLEDGSTVLFAWKTSSESPKISLKELSGIYEDDRMASIQDESDLKKWKRMREIVAGSFVGLRKAELKFDSLYPPSEVQGRTGRESLADMFVDREPIVARFSAVNIPPKAKPLLGTLVAVPTR